MLVLAACISLANCSGGNGPELETGREVQTDSETDSPDAEAATDNEAENPAVPSLDPSACKPAAPFDWKGADKNYEFVSGNDFVQDKNFYLLTLFERLDSVKSELLSDNQISAISKDRDQSLRQAVTGCGTDADCYSNKLLWNDDQVSEAAGALASALIDRAGDTAFITNHLRASGMFALFCDKSDRDLLISAWTHTMTGLCKAFGKFGQGLAPDELQGLVKQVSNNHPGPLLMFEPLLYVALGAMAKDGRDEAGRYEPLAQGENRVALDYIRNINWDDYAFSVILVPGLGPKTLDEPLSEGGKMQCDLGFARWHAGLAPIIVTSGGHVHPDRTPYCEAIEMKHYLMETYGVPERAILVDPHARHTTTNLRNTARLILRYGIPPDKPALSTTNWAQNRSIGGGGLGDRCKDELGYVPFRKSAILSDNDSCWLPAVTALYADPLDPLDP